MIIKQYQIDAFASRPFEGNPAAVCILDSWPEDSLLQALAEENNLSETAYLVVNETGYALRWFTPKAEVDLCGHATLAAAHLLYNNLGLSSDSIRFATRSGELVVHHSDGQLVMDFPADPATPSPCPALLQAALGLEPIAVLKAADYLVIVESQAQVQAVNPDMEKLKALDLRGVIVSAPGENHDFVSRFFAPKYGIPEDPVTGSAHCILTSYWAQRLGKTLLTARQISARGGEVGCELIGSRVRLSGRAITLMETLITLNQS